MELVRYRYLFPSFHSKKEGKGRLVLIGIGCNLGNCYYRFVKVVKFLKRGRGVEVVATSPLYYNPPFGFLNQPHFWNGVILLKTSLSPFRLLKLLQRMENRHHRRRTIKDGPRTLDLDILWWEGVEINSPTLQIPHPGFRKRKSVQLPVGLIGKEGRGVWKGGNWSRIEQKWKKGKRWGGRLERS
jgi:2-amino-4-hydroxy-6-hydroxymethyldihydropteridine diphosphokinase